MKTNKLILPINKTHWITLQANVPLLKLTGDNCLDINLISPGSILSLFKNNFAFLCLDDLSLHLSNILNGKKELRKSIKSSLGLLWNDAFYTCKKHSQCSSACEKRFSIKKYLILSVACESNTWLYTHNKKIFLEVAPTYPWLFNQPKATEDCASYTSFIKIINPI